MEEDFYLHLDDSFILPDVTDFDPLSPPPPLFDNFTVPDLPGFPPSPDQPDTPVTPLPPLPFTPTTPVAPGLPFTPTTPVTPGLPFTPTTPTTNFDVIDIPNHPTVWLDEFGYGYIRTKSHSSTSGLITTYLKCRNHVDNCKGTANVKKDTLNLGKQHSCTVTPGKWLIEKAMAEMKQLAASSTVPLKDIYNKVLARSGPLVQANLTWPKMEQQLRYHRNQTLPPGF